MEIGKITTAIGSVPQLVPSSVGPTANGSFGELLGKAVNDLNQLQNSADDAVNRLALGEPIDLHSVSIAVQEAEIGFQLALQIRNKLVEAYQEVMRMQV